ncbi:MAG TPA: penicillin acylase family protein, partial [Afifellaceae bacterium]|nr:penicillin acylase family protein [Afifellaceae bacterium]
MAGRDGDDEPSPDPNRHRRAMRGLSARRTARTFGGLALLAAYAAAAAARWRPRRMSLEERLAQFPHRKLPLKAPVIIRWNDHQIPFIEAEHDSDLAVALGLVHAHLRLGQMSMMR